jgi:ubiquinol-cytochrome c reductase cytochrome c subunit
VTALAARRRHPLASVVLVVLGLLVTGVLYAVFAPGRASAADDSQDQIAKGRALFVANCATCHGLDASGRNNAPSLIGVGAASVDFQVGTGRMPLEQSAPQAPELPVRFTPEQIAQLAAYIGSLGPGPAIPDQSQVDPAQGDASRGAAIFRTNCAMCHNFAGMGGALTRGKYAPSLQGTSPTHIYEAMLTGPESMPVFDDQTMTPQDKRDIIAYLTTTKEQPTPGGFSLGFLGPVNEGLVAFLVGLTALIGCAVWLGWKSS